MARLAVLLAMTVAAGAQPAASFAVGGVLRASDGKPLVSATLKLHAIVDGREHPASVGDVRLRPDGGYWFVNVVPGQYMLRAHGRTERDGAALFASLAINVQGRDVQGADLTLVPGGSLEGRVTVETRPGLSAVPFASARVRAPMNHAAAVGDAVKGIMGVMGVMGAIDPAGSFTLRDLAPGLHQLVIEGLPFPWLLSEASHRGRTLLGLAIEAASGERLTDVQLTIAEGAADLIGTVKLPADGSTAEALVIAFPADRGLRLFPIRYVRAVRLDRSGGYRAAGLPPGEYLVTVVSGVNESDAMGGALLGRLETDAARVVLPPATVTVHDLTMSRGRN